MWTKKTSASEPLLKCRNCRRHQNRGLILSLGRVWEIPVYCPGGVRRVGGVSLVRASAWNAGTCRSGNVSGVRAEQEEEPQVVKSREGLSTGYGAQGRTVS